MRVICIESGHGYTIDSHGNGLAYAITKDATNESVFIQGDDATMWRAEYDDLWADTAKPNTRASRFTWAELLDQMCGAYFV